MSAVADKLREAKALIESIGWVRGEYYNDNGYCALGAIQAAVTGEADCDYSLRTKPAESLLGEAIGRGVRSIVHWNDAPKRTRAEVLAAFDKAIELAESGQ